MSYSEDYNLGNEFYHLLNLLANYYELNFHSWNFSCKIKWTIYFYLFSHFSFCSPLCTHCSMSSLFIVASTEIPQVPSQKQPCTGSSELPLRELNPTNYPGEYVAWATCCCVCPLPGSPAVQCRLWSWEWLWIFLTPAPDWTGKA